jgi:tetratricopeptide (TPR) repeat protein
MPLMVHRLRWLKLHVAASIAVLVTSAFAYAAMNDSNQDYSERLDALWDFDHPNLSQARFAEEARRYPSQSREAMEAMTQVARAEGLQRRFDDADRTLDKVQSGLDTQPRVRVRYLLERGRRENSSGHAAKAVEWFQQALAASEYDNLPGASYYRVDALHMLAIASPPEQQLAWHRRSLAAASTASEARTKKWRASLLNNLGWTLHDRGDYAEALDVWQQALAAREAAQDVAGARIARWTVARGLRSLGRLDEAWSMQHALADEFASMNAPDGYVFEELAEIAMLRHDRETARGWAEKAYNLLREDPDMRANNADRLARLAELAKRQAR